MPSRATVASAHPLPSGRTMCSYTRSHAPGTGGPGAVQLPSQRFASASRGMTSAESIAILQPAV